MRGTGQRRPSLRRESRSSSQAYQGERDSANDALTQDSETGQAFLMDLVADRGHFLLSSDGYSTRDALRAVEPAPCRGEGFCGAPIYMTDSTVRKRRPTGAERSYFGKTFFDGRKLTGPALDVARRELGINAALPLPKGLGNSKVRYGGTYFSVFSGGFARTPVQGMAMNGVEAQERAPPTRALAEGIIPSRMRTGVAPSHFKAQPSLVTRKKAPPLVCDDTFADVRCVKEVECVGKDTIALKGPRRAAFEDPGVTVYMFGKGERSVGASRVPGGPGASVRPEKQDPLRPSPREQPSADAFPDMRGFGMDYDEDDASPPMKGAMGAAQRPDQRLPSEAGTMNTVDGLVRGDDDDDFGYAANDQFVFGDRFGAP